jgi:hypothetical protein
MRPVLRWASQPSTPRRGARPGAGAGAPGALCARATHQHTGGLLLLVVQRSLCTLPQRRTSRSMPTFTGIIEHNHGRLNGSFRCIPWGMACAVPFWRPPMSSLAILPCAILRHISSPAIACRAAPGEVCQPVGALGRTGERIPKVPAHKVRFNFLSTGTFARMNPRPRDGNAPRRR